MIFIPSSIRCMTPATLLLFALYLRKTLSLALEKKHGRLYKMWRITSICLLTLWLSEVSI